MSLSRLTECSLKKLQKKSLIQKPSLKCLHFLDCDLSAFSSTLTELSDMQTDFHIQYGKLEDLISDDDTEALRFAIFSLHQLAQLFSVFLSRFLKSTSDHLCSVFCAFCVMQIL